VKVPIILQDQGILTALSQSVGSCREIQEKVMIAGDRSDTYSISERRESRFSLSAHSSSVSPACTKQPRQSLLWCTRTTPQQCGHSSCSCGVAERESVRLVKSIFHCPSRPLVAKDAPFVYYFKAIHRPEAVSLVMINCVPWQNPQPRQSAASEKLTCEVERYTLHKHFYGKRGTKFPEMLIQKGKSLVFAQLFQLPFRRVGYGQCTLTTLEIVIQFKKRGVPFDDR
jgi:hypothetical protein